LIEKFSFLCYDKVIKSNRSDNYANGNHEADEKSKNLVSQLPAVHKGVSLDNPDVEYLL